MAIEPFAKHPESMTALHFQPEIIARRRVFPIDPPFARQTLRSGERAPKYDTPATVPSQASSVAPLPESAAAAPGTTEDALVALAGDQKPASCG